MSQNVGIWIDHRKAVIVSTSGDEVTIRTLQSDVAGHPHYGGQQDGGGEQKYEARHGQQLDRYYDEVIGRLDHPEAVWIFGPGEAKLELKARLARAKSPSAPTVDVDAADQMTDPQIVAKVKEHFGQKR
jgi:hypothetical protein